MRMIRTAGLMFAAMLAMSGAAQAQVQDARLPTDGQVLSTLKKRLENDRTGACVQAALVHRWGVARATYCANPQTQRTLDYDTAFEIGSVTKTMVAYLVADLVEQGQWSLDDPIAKHLPEGVVVPRQGERQITVRDIVTHMSGLPALPPRLKVEQPDNPYAALTEQDVLASLADVTLSREIGSRFEYSNFAMMVLSSAVARAYGKDLELVLRERLFEPLNMAGSYVTAPPAAAKPAQGHAPTGRPTPAWTVGSTNLAGVGMVRSTLNDMVRFARAQLGRGDEGVAARFAKTHEPQATLPRGAMGMNWRISRTDKRTIVGHEGGTGGFSSLVMFDKDARRAVVLLSDTALTDVGGLSGLALPLLAPGTPIEKPHVAQPVPAELLKALVGDYTVAGLPLKFFERDGRLWTQAQGQGAVELGYDSAGDLYGIEHALRLRPKLDGGKLDKLTLYQGGGVLDVTRATASR
jgi:serine-type D-Ala-D-Ala carboxypeptidase/endopeptidase